jgi:hypothetical protein
MAMGYVTDGRDSVAGRINGFFSFPQHPEQLLCLHSLVFNVSQGALSLEVKRPGRETDHSSPSGVEAHTILPCIFMACAQLILHIATSPSPLFSNSLPISIPQPDVIRIAR